MLLCCSAFAGLDQKSPVVSFYFQSSISSISSAKESHGHSSKVCFNPASRSSLSTPPCRTHLFACSKNSCVNTAIGSVLSSVTCLCFREDKGETCRWPRQVPSVLAVLDPQLFLFVQFTFRPLNACLWEAEDSHTFACKHLLLALVWEDGIWSCRAITNKYIFIHSTPAVDFYTTIYIP